MAPQKQIDYDSLAKLYGGVPAQDQSNVGQPPAPNASSDVSQFMVDPKAKGLIAPGNLPIWNRPRVQNGDGSYSSEYSTSFQDDKGHEVLVPTVVGGKFLTPDGKKPKEGSPEEKAMFQRAWQHYLKTKENFGVFDNPANADAYAGALHSRGDRPAGKTPDYDALAKLYGGVPASDQPFTTAPTSKTPPPVGEAHATPSIFTKEGLRERAFPYVEKALSALPVIGGVFGGIAGGGAGLETGPGAILTGSIGAGAGGGLGEDLRQVGEKLIGGDAPQSAKEAAADIGGQVLAQAGSEGIGRGVALGLRPLAKTFADTAAASKASGIKMLPSEAAGKPPSWIERFLKGSVLSQGYMEKFRAAQNSQAKSVAEGVANKISNFNGTPEELGKLVQDGIDTHQKEFRVIQNKLYGDIDKLVDEKTVRIPVTKNVPSNLVDQFGRPIQHSITSHVEQTVDNVMPSTANLKKFATQELKKLNQAEKILDPNLLSQSRNMLQTIIDAPNNMPFSAIASARSDALSKARELDQALAGKEAGLAKKMASLFDESMMTAAEKSKIPGLVDKIRDANAFTANEHRMFEQKLVKAVVSTKDPEKIATLLRAPNVGNQQTRDLFAVLPKELHGDVQKQIILDSMKSKPSDLSGFFDERQFAQRIAQIGPERGQIIFGANWQNVKKLADTLAKINGPVGLGGGSGAALTNAGVVRRLAEPAMEFIPALLTSGALAYSGHPIAAALSVPTEYVVLQRVARAMTNPEATLKMIKVAQGLVRATPYAAKAGYDEIAPIRNRMNTWKGKQTQKLEAIRDQYTQ